MKNILSKITHLVIYILTGMQLSQRMASGFIYS